VGTRHRRGRGGPPRRVRRLPPAVRDRRRTRASRRGHRRDGRGRHYITLPGYAEQFRARLGYEPFPGTLNVDLSERASAGAARWPASMRCRSTRERRGPHLRRGLVLRRHTLVTGDERYEEVHAIVPDRTHHDDDQLELIAPERLRDALGLGDGDAVEVRVAATSRADTPKAMTWRRATTKTRPRGPRRDGGRLMRADADTDVDAVPALTPTPSTAPSTRSARAIRSVSTTSRTARARRTSSTRLAPSTRRRSRTCETTRVG